MNIIDVIMAIFTKMVEDAKKWNIIYPSAAIKILVTKYIPDILKALFDYLAEIFSKYDNKFIAIQTTSDDQTKINSDFETRIEALEQKVSDLQDQVQPIYNNWSLLIHAFIATYNKVFGLLPPIKIDNLTGIK